MWIFWRIFQNDLGIGLGANPVEMVNRYLGDWALRFTLIVLSITPIVEITGWIKLNRFRRMIGLFAFTYAFLHVSNYIIADQFLNWADIWADIKKRSYITVGLISFIILIILAITSPKKAVKKLGAKRWRKLHQSIYIASIAAVVHYWMMVKGDYTNPLFYSVFLFLLLSYRIVRYFKNNFLEKNRACFSYNTVKELNSIQTQKNSNNI